MIFCIPNFLTRASASVSVSYCCVTSSHTVPAARKNASGLLMAVGLSPFHLWIQTRVCTRVCRRAEPSEEAPLLLSVKGQSQEGAPGRHSKWLLCCVCHHPWLGGARCMVGLRKPTGESTPAPPSAGSRFASPHAFPPPAQSSLLPHGKASPADGRGVLSE